MYRYHPVIDGLCVNEDGSEVMYFGKNLPIRSYIIGRANVHTTCVHVIRRRINVKKIVLECWHGMRQNRSYCAKMVDSQKGTHYTNLIWARCGGGLEATASQKLTDEDWAAIKSRLQANEALASIARDYNVSEMIIGRKKRKYINEQSLHA